jgi:magnesium-protoporphyrin O-methyltransferase
MPACCTPFEPLADRQFDRAKVAEELKRYHDNGLGPTTRLLEEGIVQAGVLDGPVLDIGAGIGSLTFALLARGLSHAIAVDASAAYIDTARQEAARAGRADDVQFVHADFVSVASEIPAAAIVTLDRVVCCYPSYEPLLEAALRHADRCLALSYPRNAWYVRVAMQVENAQRRLTGNPFRTFVHSSARMERQIRGAGFTLNSRRETWMWSVDVYTR